MNEQQSVINLIPTIYRKRSGNEYLNNLVELIDGLVGRGALPSFENAQKKKLGLYERSDIYNSFYSLSRIKSLYYSGKFSEIYDGSIQEYIADFCKRFGIYLDEAWISCLDTVNETNKDAELLTVSEVFEKLAYCLILSRKRGTLAGLLGYLNVYLPAISQADKNVDLQVTEKSQSMLTEKHHVKVYNGSDLNTTKFTEIMNNEKSFVVVFDRESLPEEIINSGKYDFKVQVVYDGSQPLEMAKLIEAARAIVNREKPAHSKYCLHVVAKGWQFKKDLNRSILNKTTMVSGEYETIYS